MFSLYLVNWNFFNKFHIYIPIVMKFELYECYFSSFVYAKVDGYSLYSLIFKRIQR